MFSEKVVKSLGKSSWIRAMFEQGEKLRKIYGDDNVFDFSIGNPAGEPPEEVRQALKDIVMENLPGIHRYMSNAGHFDIREKIAAGIKNETGVELKADNIIMTCGAAGGLNVALKALLNPQEEVIVFAPYFVEYLFYIDNHGGVPVVVPTDSKTFEPDVEVLNKYITPKTKAIIINSPNNPTGVIYSQEVLKKVADLLSEKEKEFGTNIFVISDEPYAKIVYDGVKVPSILKIFKNSIAVNSFSKSLALPGERIGYIAVNNAIDDVNVLINAMVFCNRTLGFVNAPALIQKVLSRSYGACADVESYKEKRDILYNHLTRIGFECIKPQGAFYLFPKALIDDDVEFTQEALKYNLLLVPGRGFGMPGYFRISYSVDMKTVKNSLPAFEKLAEKYRG
ncbi:MAG TPA: pyridoxal phosphate-dependent aminotransferase [Clostridiaceae bacterium]|nr:pyridoxal phosphate-dependent aminotransferase [Clostridiaceae bacterium]